MRGDNTGREAPEGFPDRALWQRSRSADLRLDDAERFLDLAGFADGHLDADDRERVADWLANDPAAASDVAAARGITGVERPEPAPEAVVARALALVGTGTAPAGTVVPFAPRHRRPPFHGMARWGSLVAAMAVAGWLGFVLGMDTSLSFTQPAQASENGFFHELLDPSTGSIGDIGEGRQT